MAQKRKKTILANFQESIEQNYSDSRSNKSGKSAMTGITGAMTAMTQGVKSTSVAGKSGETQTNLKGYRSTEEYMKAQEKATNSLMQKDSKLSDYIKFDSALGREQNIEFGRHSTLADADSLDVNRGCTFTQFAPQRRLDLHSIKSTKSPVLSDPEPGSREQVDHRGNTKAPTFEEKMEARNREIEDGLVEAPVIFKQKGGKKYQLRNRMSMPYYKSNYDNLGTVGIQMLNQISQNNLKKAA